MIERIQTGLGGLLRRVGLDDVRFSREDLTRLMVLAITCLVTALLVVDFARAPTDPLVEGDPAPRTVKAPFTFHYQDHIGHQKARAEASKDVLPAFVYRADLSTDLENRVRDAFERGRTELLTLEQAARAEDAPAPDEGLSPEAVQRLSEGFRDALGVHVPDENIAPLIADRFSPMSERDTVGLLGRAMQILILRDRENLPHDGRGMRLITLREGAEPSEATHTDLDALKTPGEARQEVSLAALEVKGNPGAIDACAAVARALVRANVSFAPLETEEARRAAEASVRLVVKTFKRGAILFRAGDTLTPDHIQVYRELQSQRGDTDLLGEVLALGLLLLLLLTSLYYFGATYLQAFTTEVRDVAAVGALLVVTAFAARLTVASSESIATLLQYDAEARSVWFFVPVAGAAMLVRSLLGVGWTWVFAFAASVVCGLMMELRVLPVIFFLVSAVAGASTIEHARDRISVLRAGVYVGMVNAVCVLFIHFVQLFVTETELSSATQIRPLWSMGFAFLGGFGSSALVLLLLPLFETVGFVTDFRLMELANLNHPLLRDLMVRAPGSYFHSVNVGTLAEAGCDRIGANGLRAKVASYFHDIGKTLKPPYFVENQRDGINRHDGLDPYTSARIIISHVTDGGKMAREHGLPQPVIDNIYMHHGTGILQYFYAEARELADDPDSVDEAAFRYPGPKPNSREAGVIMLADKVEAATRTIKVPDETNIRAMISRIINSTIADGQFSECPLTLQEIHAVADTFVQVMLGIYHHRVEYPDTKDLSQAKASNPPEASRRRASEPPREAFITLEINPSNPGETGAPRPARLDSNPPAAQVAHNGEAEPLPKPRDPTPEPAPSLRDQTRAADEETSEVVDYESLEHLPRGDT